VGALGSLKATGQRAFLAAALMMVLFFHAARFALVVFEPYLSSRPLAEALLRAPQGTLIAQGHYYDFAAVFFYTNRTALLSTDRRVNLEYGSYAPGAPKVFIEDAEFKDLWLSPGVVYLLATPSRLGHYQALVGASRLQTVATSGGRLLLTNHPLTSSLTLSTPSFLRSN
jgi:hypothetical protein